MATALVAAVGNANEFKSGRELSAWLGLVPRQHSSGNRNVLLGISKRGDRYLRTLLIHGARSALCRAERRSDRRSIWASKLKLARGFNVAAVALANKNARIVWALLTRGENYRAAAIQQSRVDGCFRPPPLQRRLGGRWPQASSSSAFKGGTRLAMVAEVVWSVMGNRSDRRFPNLSCP